MPSKVIDRCGIGRRRIQREKYENVQTVFVIVGGGRRRGVGGVFIDVLEVSRRF
jgi:hypothetical protein